MRNNPFENLFGLSFGRFLQSLADKLYKLAALSIGFAIFAIIVTIAVP